MCEEEASFECSTREDSSQVSVLPNQVIAPIKRFFCDYFVPFRKRYIRHPANILTPCLVWRREVTWREALVSDGVRREVA